MNNTSLKGSPNVNFIRGSAGHLNSRLAEAKKTKDIDLLFLGSSHTYRGFDNRIFRKSGFSSFNLGSSSQTPLQTSVLVNRYIENLNPKMVIFEVYPLSFMLDGLESGIDLVSNDANDFQSAKMALKLKNVKIGNTLIYALAHDFVGMDRNFKEAKRKDTDTYISGGFVERQVSLYKPIPQTKKKIVLYENQQKSFEQILKTLKERKCEVILVYAPISKVEYTSYSNNVYFDKLMNSYGEYYNFNKLINLNDSMHFYDSNHLNQRGVELFNAKLIEILKKRKG